MWLCALVGSGVEWGGEKGGAGGRWWESGKKGGGRYLLSPPLPTTPSPRHPHPTTPNHELSMNFENSIFMVLARKEPCIKPEFMNIEFLRIH